MVSLVIFHVLILLLALGVATRTISALFVGNALGYLHKSIGITTPSRQQVRTVALIWIGSAILLVDGCLFLLVFITSLSNSR